MKQSTRWIAGISIGVLAVACKHGNSANQPSAATTCAASAPVAVNMIPVATVSTAGTVHRITMPHYAPLNLPPEQGKEVFAAACISCHSTRYITTQPPMNETKWTDEVHKMMKTYGAPVAEDQVPSIVQYLLAARENGDRAQTWEAITPEPAHAIADISKPSAAKSEELIARGMPLFQKSCLPCHGPQGHGDGPTAATILPRPQDFSHAKFSDRLIAMTIQNGVRGSAMPAFPFSKDDVDALVAVVQTFEPIADVIKPATQPLDPSQGKMLFAANCASCHGANGEGDGLAAAVLARQAANFHLKRPTQSAAIDIITNGVSGTPMPGWRAKLNESQRWALADYVRGFYGEDKNGATGPHAE